MRTGKNTHIILINLALSLLSNPFVAALGLADEVTSQDVSKISTQIKNAQKAGVTSIDCDPLGLNRAKPACSKLTDDFCSKLYDAQHDGKMNVHDGQLILGETQAGAIRASARANVQAMLDNEKRMPADLRKKVAPAFDQLQKLLAKEEDTRAWQRAFSNALDLYAKGFEEVASERAEAQHPELKKIKTRDLTVEQNNYYATAALDLDNEVVRAKFEKNPNWNRVEKLYAQVQSDLLGEIDHLNASPELKKRLKEKLGSVKLSLPYSDPRISVESSDCNKTEINADYSSKFNSFTVCAGMFNSIQSDTALYTIIAHELSHSIDPGILLLDDYNVSEVGKIEQKFYGASGPVFSCDEWTQLVQNQLNPQRKMTEPQYVYQKLTDCFIPKDQLRPFTDENARKISESQADAAMGRMADQKSFDALATPTIQKKGKTVPNEFYMRPDRLQASTLGYVFPSKLSEPTTEQLFVQSLSCLAAKVNGKEMSYEQAPVEAKKAIYKQAILNTRDVYQAIIQARYSSCGRECDGLTDYGLSRPSAEHFADWLAIRALPKFLSRIKSMETRRKAASTSTAFFCEAPGPWSGAPWMAKIDKEFSLEPHPDMHSRRMSFFTKAVAEAVGCERDEDVVTGDSSCDL